jgi:hypothetical protein
VDQHRSETDIALQSLREALKELERIAVVYGNHQRLRIRNYLNRRVPSVRTIKPGYSKAIQHRVGWRGLFDAGRDVWRWLRVKLRFKN